MKSFSHQLTELNEGSIHSALTADFAELLRTVQATGRAGSLTLKVKVVPRVDWHGLNMAPHTTIIGLAGPAGSGKDTVRAILENKHDFCGLAFASPIRGMVRELLVANGCSADYITNRELKETPIPGLGVSARHMMQTLGTEWARKCLAEDFWLKLAATYMADLRGQGYRQFVISDVRFANEAEWVRAQGGEVWMIERPGLQPVRQHVSECAQFRVDQVLRNDGTLADLERATLNALASAKRFARAGREAA